MKSKIEFIAEIIEFCQKARLSEMDSVKIFADVIYSDSFLKAANTDQAYEIGKLITETGVGEKIMEFAKDYVKNNANNPKL